MAKKEANKEGVQVTLPAEVMNDNPDGKVDLVVEADNVVVNQPMERNGEAAGAKAVMDDEMPDDIKAAMQQFEQPPQTKSVQTGTNVLTGEPVFKDVPVKQEKDYSEGRKQFPVHTSVNGSFNGRRMKLVKGETVYLDPAELKVFRNYVSGAGK